MRKLTLIPIAAITVFGALFTVQSCDKVNKLHYDLPMQTASVEITIPPSIDTNSVQTVGTGTTNFNIDSFIKANTANALGVNNITSIKLTSAKLTLLDGNATNNFANFSKANASFYTNTNNTAYTRTIDPNPDVEKYDLDLPVDPNVDLKSYVSSGTTNYYYTVGGKLRRPVTQAVKCKVEFKFNVTVNN